MASLIFHFYRKWRQSTDEHGQTSPSSSRVGLSGSTGRRFLSRFSKNDILLFIVIAIPIYLETLDLTVVATTQSLIASHFNRLDLQSYIGTVYLMASTAFLPLFVCIADIYGRHFALQISLLFFLVGSAISTGAFSMITIIVGRGIAGIGAAGLLTLPRIILSDSASSKEQTTQTTILTVLYAIGYGTGPVIGGALSSISFRWIFAVNLPATATAMILAFLILRGRSNYEQDMTDRRVQYFLGKSRLRKIFSLDWLGTLVFIASGILILLALNWGSTQQWSADKVIVSFVVGGVLFLLCIGWEVFLQWRQEEKLDTRLWKVFAILPAQAFTSIDVVVAQAVIFVAGIVMLVISYYLAIFYIIVNGSSATNAGAQLLYFVPGVAAGSFISRAIIKQTQQPKYAVILGSLVTAVALGLVSQAVYTNNNSMVDGTLFMAGAGSGLSLVPAAAHARFSQPTKMASVITSYQRFFQSFGGAVGLAQASAVLNSQVRSHIAAQVRSGVISPADADSLQFIGGALSSINAIAALPQDLHIVVQDAFRIGTRWLFISLVPWAGVAFLLSLLLSKTAADKNGSDVEHIQFQDENDLSESALHRQGS